MGLANVLNIYYIFQDIFNLFYFILRIGMKNFNSQLII